MTGLLTGLRSAERCAVDIGDLWRTDDGGGTVRVRHGKGNKERVVPIEAALLAVIDDYLDSRAARHNWPRVLSAGRTHQRLARQCSEMDLRDALSDARHFLVFWAHSEDNSAAGILQTRLEAHVAAYPDVIAIAATLLTARPRVEQPSTPTEPAWPTLLLDRINERTGAHHADATPSSNGRSTDACSPLPY